MPDPETERLLRLHNELDNAPLNSDVVAAKKAIAAVLYNEHGVANIQRAQTDLGLNDAKGRPLNWYGDNRQLDSVIASLEEEM